MLCAPAALRARFGDRRAVGANGTRRLLTLRHGFLVGSMTAPEDPTGHSVHEADAAERAISVAAFVQNGRRRTFMRRTPNTQSRNRCGPGRSAQPLARQRRV